MLFAHQEADPGSAELEMPSIGLSNRSGTNQQDAHPLFLSGQYTSRESGSS
jgi:hypothetical protein